MTKKRILGIIIAIIGISLLGTSFYIKNEVKKGRGQISSAQKKEDAGKKLFSTNPFTKELGKGLTSGIQKKINEGTVKADTYALIANILLVSGIVLIVAGGVIVVLPQKRK
jgi:hypothetical protein